MALKDLMQKMQGAVEQMTARREEGQTPQRSVMPDGSVSGHQPVVGRRKSSFFGNLGRKKAQDDEASATAMPPLQPNVPPRPTAQAVPPQTPYGNQSTSQPMPPPQSGARASWNQRSQSGQWSQGYGTSNQPPVQPQQQYGTSNQPPVQPRQQYATSNQPPVQPQQQYATPNQPPVQPQQQYAMPNQPPVQGRHQANGQNPWPNGVPQQNNYAQQGQQPVQQQPVQQQVGGTIYDFLTGKPQDTSNAYAMTLRVAQITGMPSCYHLLGFMQREEAVIVNAEQITDQVEVARCMDMLFGAASAMNKSFDRIAGRMIYLIAPRNVHVVACDNVLQISQSDRERRWPGSSRMGAQARRDEFQPAFGQRASAPQQPQYTDHGGFGNYTGFSGHR